MRRYWPVSLALLVLSLSTLLMSGCALSMPFQKQPAMKRFHPDTFVVVSLTKAVEGDDSEKNDRFWEGTRAVINSLKEGAHPGLLGHAVRTEVFGNSSWTMTVWKDEESLENFIKSPVHKKAMRSGYDALSDAKVARFERRLKDVPLSWSDVDQILLTQKSYAETRH